ncbi:zinc knuckle CX2CX4HX4C containing protein [Tanacetum coccineum]
MVKTGLVEAIDSLVPLDEHFATFRVWGILDTDIQEKEQKESQNQAIPSTEWKGQSQKFVLKMLGFSEWLEVHALASKVKGNSNDLLLKNLKAKFQEERKRSSKLIKKIFVKEDIVVDGMHINLVPPPGVVPSEGLVISDPESRIFFYNEARDYLVEARKIVENNLDNLGQNWNAKYCKLAECKASASNEDPLSAKHQRTSNIRRIQVRNIVKEVKDYLKTYSSAEMDISCLSTKLVKVVNSWQNCSLKYVQDVSKNGRAFNAVAFTPLSNLHISPLIPPEGLYKFACKLDTLSSLLVQMIILHYKCYTSKETCKLGLSATVGTSDTPSNNREDGSVNVIKSDKLSSMGPVFYANHLNGEPSKKVANLRNLITPDGNGGGCYSMVENYVKNAWSRVGLVRTLMNLKGIFFFKFCSNMGMESMLENGPCLIRNVSLLLRRWSPLANVFKEDLESVPVQVKLLDVPITAFMEDGLSSITTKHGTLLILDTYTTSMCLESWGRSSFVRAIIDLHANVDLKDTFVVVVPKLEDLSKLQLLRRRIIGRPSRKIRIPKSMVEKDIRVTQSDSVNSKGNDVNLGDSKDVKLDNADIDNENDVEDDDETSSSMASKNSKGTGSSKSVGGTGMKNLYKR